MKEIKTAKYKYKEAYVDTEDYTGDSLEECLEECSDVCDTEDCREDCAESCEEDFGDIPGEDPDFGRYASYASRDMSKDAGLGDTALDAVTYVPSALLSGGLGAMEGAGASLLGRDKMQDQTFKSNAFKQKLMQIYQIINSDPEIIKAVPSLRKSMNEMQGFVSQQERAAEEQEQSIAMARYRRQQLQDKLDSGELRYRGSPSTRAETPDQGNQNVHPQLRSVTQKELQEMREQREQAAQQ
tara:strand:+ start:143 stop:865 length:723 start_codon:yes stop_codon:yes gene_type:complete